MIRAMKLSDIDAILEIYRLGLETGEASFEQQVPDSETWQKKYLPIARLVWEQDSTAIGWAALAPVSARDCYRGVTEISIYIHPDHQSRGIGSKLMQELVKESEANGIWSLYSSIFPENSATRKLHLRHGFREVGMRQRIAQQNGRWRDTLILERRSTLVGL